MSWFFLFLFDHNVLIIQLQVIFQQIHGIIMQLFVAIQIQIVLYVDGEYGTHRDHGSRGDVNDT